MNNCQYLSLFAAASLLVLRRSIWITPFSVNSAMHVLDLQLWPTVMLSFSIVNGYLQPTQCEEEVWNTAVVKLRDWNKPHVDQIQISFYETGFKGPTWLFWKLSFTYRKNESNFFMARTQSHQSLIASFIKQLFDLSQQSCSQLDVRTKVFVTNITQSQHGGDIKTY